MQNRVPAPIVPDLAFAAVPRKHRHDGWTPERQRGFIAALAETGSVKAAARRINMSPEGAYALRRQPGAEGFVAAWAAALAHGLQRLTDLAIDRAIEGVPVPIFWRGEQVGERRVFNERLLMFILKHHLPAQYDSRPLPRGTRHSDTITREDAEAAAAASDPDTAAAPDDAALDALATWLADLLDRYRHKLVAERRHRLAGEVAAADFTLRQALELELLLALGGAGEPLLALWRDARARGSCPAAHAIAHGLGASDDLPDTASSPTVEQESAPAPDPADPEDPFTVAAFVVQELARVRHAVWAVQHDPDRPDPPSGHPGIVRTGPTHAARAKARAAARQRIAQAQAEWEAAASEEGWARFTGAPEALQGIGDQPNPTAEAPPPATAKLLD